MVFITAGLGGGTGTGAAPIIAKSAKEKGILTVCVVTKPFEFEGSHRKRVAEEGIQEIQKYADTLIVIPNQNLFRLANEKTGFAEAFSIADNVLHKGVCGVTDLMVKPGMIYLDVIKKIKDNFKSQFKKKYKRFSDFNDARNISCSCRKKYIRWRFFKNDWK